MTEYLKPRACANWDEDLKRRIVADLRSEGIEPDKLDDKSLVEKVSNWAIRRSNFNSQFGLWMVEFKGGKPFIPTDMEQSFNAYEPKGVPRPKIYDRELYGKGMYLNKTHGACTSSSTYMATILRALGIPTRIILTVPACDGNDQAQVRKLVAAVRYHQAARAIKLAGASNGFANHVFNEVFVGGKWVRLNYNKLGQSILDAGYGGLLTHVYTALDISEVPFAKTWGARFALEQGPKLSSINPYQLLTAKDDLQPGAPFVNPEVEELKIQTVIAVVKPGDPGLPDWAKLPVDSDAFFQVKEWIKGQNYMQMRDFVSDASSTFVLTSPGNPSITATLSGLNVSDEHGGFQAYAVKLSAKPAPGAVYSIVPQNGDHPHKWFIESGLKWPA
jgi:hypothetical protein